MIEKLNPVDRISQIDDSLDILWQKYGKNNSYKATERENGRNLLTKLGITREAITVIKACAIFDDVILEHPPKDVLNLSDLIPTITQAISGVQEEASRKQLDLKTELITIYAFLYTLKELDQEVYVDSTDGKLDATFYDKTFLDLLNSVDSATKYF